MNHQPMRRVLLLLQAYIGLLELSSARDKYSEFCVPMVMVPATVSNNIPGSDLSIGSDTALNAITDVSDVGVTVRRTNRPALPIGVRGHLPLATRSLMSTTRNSTYCKQSSHLAASLRWSLTTSASKTYPALGVLGVGE